MKGSQEAATRMTGLQDPGGQRAAREHSEQSGSQVRVSAKGEDGAHLPHSDQAASLTMALLPCERYNRGSV